MRPGKAEAGAAVLELGCQEDIGRVAVGGLVLYVRAHMRVCTCVLRACVLCCAVYMYRVARHSIDMRNKMPLIFIIVCLL